jgi:hypothetical protein
VDGEETDDVPTAEQPAELTDSTPDAVDTPAGEAGSTPTEAPTAAPGAEVDA